MNNLAIEHGDGVILDDHDGVLVVTLDRPPANSLDGPLIREIGRLFTELAATHSPPPIVLTGYGERFFCAGGDIKELDSAHIGAMDSRMASFHAMLVAIESYPRPVVAAVNGHCVGGGMEIALFADAVFAVGGARFGFPEINHGLLPADKGIQRTSQLLGMRTARHMLLGGHLFDAGRARELGIVDELVDPDELLDAAVESARAAGRKAAVLYAAIKRSVNNPNSDLDEASLQRTLIAAADYYDDPVATGLRQNWNSDHSRAKAQT
ncbi:enoyl-CoA hydratase/isomerase family protein [Rhodococcus fascians]|uniref:enoyl-CoA hydratase/isomerase family protein n=1 Tax=Rhodococcoides fascians TaxID=1828 RepID=UPI0019562322|nr:enoyl-CoA hydratase/isomerase family protein [Rhodococcus fascians]MBM7242549.1 enoyl-CoA hydratase/isomerase family protein [Rhodococcus fascians]MBY3811995.1 enoyl-CoA hydratase/isomerase family protein [Rhodococcus fascians]MBY3840697.1 enoyl-CoA hydratase/isomerase family protein [Rhodococcus fascians]MBY3848171.1 enoyl-CoA hydratase/isomerase family protein [Rhodococcus fascians]MBY3853292.1 enoyl-CoA hydratase/isomerase family protein [Rhodococcus fascians]